MSPKKRLAVVSASVVTILIVVVVSLASLQLRSKLQSDNELPVASFTYAIDVAALTVAFNASESYDPNGSIADYSWSFGDGAIGNGVIVTHIYLAYGIYETVLTVTDDEGGKNHISERFAVNYRPKAVMTKVYQKDFTVVLSGAESYDPDGGSLVYEWVFSRFVDPDPGEFYFVQIRVAYEVEVTHVFDAAGEYWVTLAVTDDEGITTSTTCTFDIPFGG